MGKRGHSSTSYQDRVVRQRHVDYFWKTLHECCGSLPTEEDIAKSLLAAAGIKSKRQLREQTELDLKKLSDILDKVNEKKNALAEAAPSPRNEFMMETLAFAAAELGSYPATLDSEMQPGSALTSSRPPKSL